MPVRSLTSSTLKWPDAQTVDEAVRALAQRLAGVHPELRRLGYFGSYARGDWGWAVTSISWPSSPAPTAPLPSDHWISILAGCPAPAATDAFVTLAEAGVRLVDDSGFWPPPE